MKLVVGLGNIGEKYKNTRHNIGFVALESLAYTMQATGFKKSNFNGDVCKISFDNQRIALLKPTTYMNSSGLSVYKYIKYHSLSLKDLIVIHDDMEIKVGSINAKTGGSNKGHNGLRSISAQLGNEYKRIRIGIDRPSNKDEVSDYVLSDFTKSERDLLDCLIHKISNNISLVLSDKLDEFNKLFL